MFKVKKIITLFIFVCVFFITYQTVQWTQIPSFQSPFETIDFIVDEGYVLDGNNDHTYENLEMLMAQQRSVRLVFELNDTSFEGQDYQVFNQMMFNQLPINFSYHQFYASKYTPFVELYVDQLSEKVIDQLKSLEQQSSLVRIYVERIAELETPTGTPIDDRIKIEPPLVDAGDPMQKEPVKIGLYESRDGIPNRYNPVFENIRSFVFHPVSPHSHDESNVFHRHGHQVAEVMVMHYNANHMLDLYFAPTSVGYFQGIEWFIDNNVDIVNMSFSYFYNLGDYHHRSRYLDFVSYQTSVLFVVAAGNRGLTDRMITPPATGFNVLTVGALEKETSNNMQIYRLAKYSSHALQSYFTNSKPNLVEDGASNAATFTGTSFSAPRVTAEIGKFLSYHPEYKRNLAALLTIVHSAASFEQLKDSYDQFDPSGLESRFGAGIFDVYKARQIIRDQNLQIISIPAIQNAFMPQTIYQTSLYLRTGMHLRFTVATLVDIKEIGDQIVYPVPPMSNYMIRLYKDDNFIFETVGLINIEMLMYEVPSMASGLYRIEIIRLTGIAQSRGFERVGLSYRIQM